MEIMLDSKMEKFCTLLDKQNVGELNFELLEVHSWLNENTIQFDEQDMLRWLNTTNDFIMKIYIGNREFNVSTMLLERFEIEFNTNFHKTLYSIQYCN